MIAQYFTYRNLYILGFSALFFCLPVSVYVLSISQFFLGLIWLVERDYIQKLKRVAGNKYFWLFALLYLLHIVSLLYTSNFGDALDELRIKLPLLLVPFFFASIPKLSTKEYKIIAGFFILGLIISIGASYYLYYVEKDNLAFDPRNASRFVSHIRLSLMLALGSIMLGYEAITTRQNWAYKSALLIIAMVFLAYMISLKMLTGIVVFIIALFIILELHLFSQNRKLFKLVALVLPIAISALIGLYVYSFVKTFIFPNVVDYSERVERSANGGKYDYHPEILQLENGNRVWDFLSEYEMEIAWDKRSEIKYKEKELTGQPIRVTLIRFLTSKNIRKDRYGVEALSEDEIEAIENGVTNYRFMTNKGLSKRIYETAWELHNYLVNKDNPSGNSVAQRIEFWKAAKHVINKNWLIGVGAGDLKDELNLAYTESNSVLNEKYRSKPHNQYITFFVYFGFIGLVWFLIVLLQSYEALKKDIVGVSFFIIVTLSMITEDTLETQIGASFFIAFMGLYTIGLRHEDVPSAEIRD
ncbi:MAG: hypothetical protein CL840_07820 [Crocinitomicaceae bacterium]|mgnify:CR=1 FL=1|nr:hypothetical protein [Crocinitomicaceae bacterium]|tara:strand:+ start:3541 stop:5124 length:1584 start_codon:yes stop_codon:yes gene_type:complete